MQNTKSYAPLFLEVTAAAAIFHEPVDMLLDLATKQTIELMITIPAGAEIKISDRLDETRPPKPMREPDFLRLEGYEIYQLRINKKATFRETPIGFRIDREGKIERMPACDEWYRGKDLERNNSKLLPTRSCTWTLATGQNANNQISINISDIRIATPYIDELRANLFDKIDIDLSYPRKMRCIDAAFHLFWRRNGVIFSKRETYPEAETIIRWFLNEGFSQAEAVKATSFITPDEATTRGRKPKTTAHHKKSVLSTNESDLKAS